MNKSSETGTEYQTNDVQFIETSRIVANVVASGQKKSWELKFFSSSGKSQGISLWVRENLHRWKKSGKCEIASEHEVVELVWAFYMIKDGDTSLFVMLMLFMYIV